MQRKNKTFHRLKHFKEVKEDKKCNQDHFVGDTLKRINDFINFYMLNNTGQGDSNLYSCP